MKAPDPESSSESNDENEDDDVRLKGKGKKKRKNRDGNFAAGLALMHGFAATNVGASRLTVSGFQVSFIECRADASQSSNPRQDFSIRERPLVRTPQRRS